jgi:hypothetical protein
MCQNTVSLKVLKMSVTAYRKEPQYVSNYSDKVLKWSVTAYRKEPQYVSNYSDI